MLEFSVELKPISCFGVWTGGADNKMSYLKATSLLGGLRFWTGAILRSLGHNTCHENICIHDPLKPDKTCSLCKIFGCTGLAREFSMRITADGTPEQDNPMPQKFKMFKYGHTKNFTVSLAVHRPSIGGGARLSPYVLNALILMIKYGALGARDQYGCGFVDPINTESNENWQKALQILEIPQSYKAQPAAGLSFQDFFFFKGRLKDKPEDVQFPMRSLRAAVRQEARKLNNTPFKHWFCGFIPNKECKYTNNMDKEKYGSKYNFTITPEGYLYGWGHFNRQLPPDLKKNINYQERYRDEMLNGLKNTFQQYSANFEWKEFNSSRDTDNSPKNWPDFLKKLLQSSWRYV